MIFSDLADLSGRYLEEGYSKPKISCSHTDSKLRYLLEVVTTPKQADEVISVIDFYNPIHSDKAKIKAAWRTTAFVKPESAVLTNRSAFEVLSIIKRSAQPIFFIFHETRTYLNPASQVLKKTLYQHFQPFFGSISA
ncbi:MAG: hypothetical protein AAF740_10395, partial [Bacteroidota bacterium]